MHTDLLGEKTVLVLKTGDGLEMSLQQRTGQIFRCRHKNEIQKTCLGNKSRYKPSGNATGADVQGLRRGN